jgi:hypothetical protein
VGFRSGSSGKRQISWHPPAFVVVFLPPCTVRPRDFTSLTGLLRRATPCEHLRFHLRVPLARGNARCLVPVVISVVFAPRLSGLRRDERRMLLGVTEISRRRTPTAVDDYSCGNPAVARVQRTVKRRVRSSVHAGWGTVVAEVRSSDVHTLRSGVATMPSVHRGSRGVWCDQRRHWDRSHAHCTKRPRIESPTRRQVVSPKRRCHGLVLAGGGVGGV